MKQRGLTLIEMLISLFIFSLIALASYRVLSASLMLDERLQSTPAELISSGAAMERLRNDIEHIRFRLASNDKYPELRAEGRLRWLRSSPRMSEGRLGVGLFAVQYQLLNNNETPERVRQIWHRPGFEGEPDHTETVLAGFRNLSIEIIDEGQRLRRWPPANIKDDDDHRPEAIDLRWRNLAGGEQRMLLVLP